MKRIATYLVAATALMMSGCEGEKKIQSVSYYRLDVEARNAMLEECRTSVNTIEDQNCSNAIEAEEYKPYQIAFPELNFHSKNTLS